MHEPSGCPWRLPPNQTFLRTRARIGREIASAIRDKAAAATIMQGRHGFWRLTYRSRVGNSPEWGIMDLLLWKSNFESLPMQDEPEG